jgi:hypothetical protein
MLLALWLALRLGVTVVGGIDDVKVIPGGAASRSATALINQI